MSRAGAPAFWLRGRITSLGKGILRIGTWADSALESGGCTPWRKDNALVCECGWRTTWGEYLKSYQRKQLVGGKAYPDFLAFLERWPNARAYRDKVLAIDRLIHALHIDAKLRSFRPAAVNVIECNMREALQLLHELAYGAQSTPGVQETRAQWAATTASIGESMREYWSKRALERKKGSAPERTEEGGG